MSKQYTIEVNGERYAIPESDIWRKPGVEKDIISHDGIRRLMLQAGITLERVEPIVMPIGENAMRIAFLASGTNAEGRRAFAVGESDPSNLTPNTVAARYPTIMAFKRAVDRLVLDLLGLFDLYSDVEFADPAMPPQTSQAESGGDNGSRSAHQPSAPRPANGPGQLSPEGARSTPPTDKQIAYLWRLSQQQGLRESEIDQMLRMLRTREGASKLIAKMRQST